jgi:hypothetical protein
MSSAYLSSYLTISRARLLCAIDGAPTRYPLMLEGHVSQTFQLHARGKSRTYTVPCTVLTLGAGVPRSGAVVIRFATLGR